MGGWGEGAPVVLLASFWEVRPSIASTAFTREHVGHWTCMQHATCDMVPTCNIKQPRPHSRSCTFGHSSRECTFMLNHVARFPLPCWMGLHVGSARGARCILHTFCCTLQRAEMLHIATCCEPTGNFIAVLHDGQMRTSSSCRTADHAETRSHIPLSVFGLSGYSVVLQVPCAGLAGSVRQSTPSARCTLHLALRAARCPQRLWGASFGARGRGVPARRVRVQPPSPSA